MDTILLELQWKPLSSQNIYWQRTLTNKSWKGKISVRYMKKPAKALKKSYIKQIQTQYTWKATEKEVAIGIVLVFWDKRRRDWDNWHKLSMDALEWTILVDDSQIQRATVQKIYKKWDWKILIMINEYKKDQKLI